MTMFKSLFLCGLLFAFCSCGSSSQNEDSSGHEETSVISSLSNLADAADKMEENYDKLANATPLTNDQWKAWMPKTLDGMKRTAYTIGGAGFVKINSLHATYANIDQSKKIEMTVVDGADSLGASLIGMARMGLSVEYEKEDQKHIEKSVEKNGHKAQVKYQKDNSRSSIKFIQSDRFLITVEGDSVKIDELWEVVDELDVEELK